MEADYTAWLAVALGGALGAVLRGYLLSLWQEAFVVGRDRAHVYAPALATLCANTMGCLALGDWVGRDALELGVFGDFYAVGLCGGLTTFSTLCAEIVRSGRQAGPGPALAYALITIFLGGGAFSLGAGLTAS